MDNRLLVNSGFFAARGKAAIPKPFENMFKQLQRVFRDRKGLYSFFVT
jgi:hypothetical protein